MQISAVGRLKHTDLWRAAQKVGGQAALARYLNVNPQELCGWCNLKGLPPVTAEDLTRRPTWNADRHAEFERKLFGLTGKTLDELFPPALRECREFFDAPKDFEQTREIENDQLLGYAQATSGRRRLLGPHEQVEQGEVKELIHRVLVTLPEREQRILTQRFGLDGHTPKTLNEIAAVEGCTRENIRHIEQRALDHLRMRNRIQPLLPYSKDA